MAFYHQISYCIVANSNFRGDGIGQNFDKLSDEKEFYSFYDDIWHYFPNDQDEWLDGVNQSSLEYTDIPIP